jgi:hypothetical protein
MLRDKMPSFYSSSQMMLELFRLEDLEIQSFQSAVVDAFNQFDIDTATWSISRWEKEFGFYTNKDNTVWNSLENKSTTFNEVEGMDWNTFEKMFPIELEERRSAVKSRMRGAGTVTVEGLKNICNAYVNGRINVIESLSDYKIIIEFIDERGYPSNIETLKQIISQVIPAHIAVEYQYRYLTWNEFDSFGWSWSQIDAKQLTFDELSVYGEE